MAEDGSVGPTEQLDAAVPRRALLNPVCSCRRPLLTFGVSGCRGVFVPAWTPCKGGLGLAVALILGGLHWRSGSPAMLGPAAPSPNSLRSLRSLRSDTGDESVVDSRCARGPRVLRFSAPPMRATASPSPPLQTTVICVPASRADTSAGLGESGGPRSEVKGETEALAAAKAASASGVGHERRGPPDSPNPRDKVGKPNVRNGPTAALHRPATAP